MSAAPTRPQGNYPAAAVPDSPPSALSGATTFALTAERAGERLDVFLARRLDTFTRSAAHRLVEAGDALVDGRREKCSYRLSAGETVHGSVPAARPSALEPEPPALSVVYEDHDMLVVDKPAGLVVHPSAGHETGTLVHRLLGLAGGFSGIGGERRPGIVHRLDKDTSGLLLVAKHDAAHLYLARQFEQRSICKHYLALVRGALSPSDGLIDAPIGRHPVNRQKMAITERGRQARTRYRSLATARGHVLVVAALESGRTHQLRVHFASMGHPIAGDPIYGTAGGPGNRLWLHAWRLAFARPRDGAIISLEAPLPDELLIGWSSIAGGATCEAALDDARRWAVSGRGST